MIFRLLGIFVNILTPDNKYYLLKRDNLRQSMQMQLSQKGKTFSEFVFAFLKCSLNFESFQKKDDPYSRSISEIKDSEKRC